MDNLSKVIFTCLAISITLLVYQNTQLKNDLDTLRGFVELDTKAQWERIEALENPYKGAIDVEAYEKCLNTFLGMFSIEETFTDEAKEEYCKDKSTIKLLVE